ncbi:hypothetical protein V1477_007283 [Vespula maculifrons]|uniref:Uncharacterized protein n=1 Tax=Vespula maculifrons TaxID=7453 RepID=A0ABD2CI37_VESMC
MGKTTLIASLILSIVIAMTMSLDTPELKLIKAHNILDQSYISNIIHKLRNIQGEAKQPDVEVYLLKQSSNGNWNPVNEKKPLVHSETNNIDCQCKCTKKKPDGLTGRPTNNNSGYHDDPMETHGNIDSTPTKKKSFSCAPDSFWDGSKCAQIV